MILSGPQIEKEVAAGRIVIDPFERAQLNPNSYNYRLDPVIREVKDLPWEPGPATITIPESGYVLQPRKLYLGATFETIGSDAYVISLIGRSTIGRLGLFLQITADLGHQGTKARWTLEMTVVQPLRVYPRMQIGQVSFWAAQGESRLYNGKYAGDQRVQSSQLARELRS